jgi:murein DD-endopeptidase MepM/ murein hydrolase activator NlpD
MPKKKLTIEELTAKRNMLQKMLAALLGPHQLFDRYYYVTQGFGVKNPIYKQTGVHIGTDFGTPLNTPVYAPYDGMLTSTVGKETGLIATFETAKGTYQFLHLNGCAVSGIYKRGQQIAQTGNTGTLTTGPHCCVRLWKGKPNISILTKNNVHEYLLDVIL